MEDAFKSVSSSLPLFVCLETGSYHVLVCFLNCHQIHTFHFSSADMNFPSLGCAKEKSYWSKMHGSFVCSLMTFPGLKMLIVK